MKRYIFCTILVSFFIFNNSFAQNGEQEAPPVHKDERGFSLVLASNGIGVGVFYRKALPSYLGLGADIRFFILRDDKEVTLRDPFSGRLYKIGGHNRLFLIPLNIELKKRLFVDQIEDNFRPHVLSQVGAVFGMNFPKKYIDRETRKELDPPDQYQFGYNVILGTGVDFSTKKDYFATLRIQYRIVYFTDEIANKKNHSAFEISFELGRL